MSHENESPEPDKQQPSTIPFDPTNRTAYYDRRDADQVVDVFLGQAGFQQLGLVALQAVFAAAQRGAR